MACQLKFDILTAIDLYKNQKMSIREIAKELNCVHSTIGYNLKKHIKLRNRSEAAVIGCRKFDSNKEKNPNWKDGRSNWKDFKYNLLKLKGGECRECYISATINNTVIFDFHHINPYVKRFEISKHARIKYTNDEFQVELDKCLILCSNCHRLYHYTVTLDGFRSKLC